MNSLNFLHLFANQCIYDCTKYSLRIQGLGCGTEDVVKDISNKYTSGQVIAWQSATLLPISCKSVRPVSARVEEPVSPERQSSSGGVTYNPPFPKMP